MLIRKHETERTGKKHHELDTFLNARLKNSYLASSLVSINPILDGEEKDGWTLPRS